MGAGGQCAAGEGVADGAHGFRVVKILVVSDVMFCLRSQNSDASLYLKHRYSFYIRVEYQRHENNLARRAQLMCSVHLSPTLISVKRTDISSRASTCGDASLVAMEEIRVTPCSPWLIDQTAEWPPMRTNV